MFEPLHRPGRSVYFGHDRIRTLHADLRHSAEDGRGRFDEYLELPDGRIQVRGYQIVANGKVGPKVSPTVTVRAGLIVHLQGRSAADEL